MNFQIENLSKQYTVRKLTDTDVAAVYALCKENPLYYQYCPPFVTEDSIRADMAAQGVETLYLVTDHTAFYERYGWRFLTTVHCDDGCQSRLYTAQTPAVPEAQM